MYIPINPPSLYAPGRRCELNSQITTNESTTVSSRRILSSEQICRRNSTRQLHRVASASAVCIAFATYSLVHDGFGRKIEN